MFLMFVGLEEILFILSIFVSSAAIFPPYKI
jgi:hypothetical protein